MSKEHRGRKPNMELKEKVKKMVDAGYSYPEIAETLGIKSRQMARYHYETYPQSDNLTEKK